MDFGALPPEINSARMYAGPGSASLRGAAASWQSLAGELRSAAAAGAAVVAELTATAWSGPSASAMAAAATPYLAWLDSTAVQAEHTASQAMALAAAYESAYATTVPPAVIAANRSQLLLLHATNTFGQNGAAIAAVEAQYSTMWAQDSATMYHYAASAASASVLKPFTPAPSTTNDPEEDELEFVTIADLLDAIPSALLPANVGIGTTGFGVALEAKAVATLVEGAIAALPPGVLSSAPAVSTIAHTAPPATATATLGGAHTLGRLSVPPTWARTAPEVRPLAVGLEGPGGSGAADEAALDSAGTVALYGDIALANLAATSVTGLNSRGGIASAMNGRAPDQLAEFVAELSNKPGSQVLQHWTTNPAELDGLLAELSKKPGIHAVHLKGGKKLDVAAPEPDASQPG